MQGISHATEECDSYKSTEKILNQVADRINNRITAVFLGNSAAFFTALGSTAVGASLFFAPKYTETLVGATVSAITPLALLSLCKWNQS